MLAGMAKAQTEHKYVRAVIELRRAVRGLVDAEKKLSVAERDYFRSSGSSSPERSTKAISTFQEIKT